MGKRGRQQSREDGTDLHDPSQMHPRNIYAKHAPDFAELGKQHAALAPFVRTNKDGKATVNFRKPEALRALTQALLLHDFGIVWSLPHHHLVPPVPNRANYVHWLEDLMDQEPPSTCAPTPPALPPALSRHASARSPRRGIDIGTGASAIYPILGVCLNPSWTFVATEICDESLANSERILKDNHLETHVELRKPPSHDAVLTGVVRDNERFDFCMCNPPFYGDRDEIGAHPERPQTGLENELIAEGGELWFVNKIIEDSFLIGERITWYSTMVGKKDDLKALRKLLFERGVVHVRSTTFVQGKTMRWGLAWTMKDVAKALSVANSVSVSLQPAAKKRRTDSGKAEGEEDSNMGEGEGGKEGKGGKEEEGKEDEEGGDGEVRADLPVSLRTFAVQWKQGGAQFLDALQTCLAASEISCDVVARVGGSFTCECVVSVAALVELGRECDAKAEDDSLPCTLLVEERGEGMEVAVMVGANAQAHPLAPVWVDALEDMLTLLCSGEL